MACAFFVVLFFRVKNGGNLSVWIFEKISNEISHKHLHANIHQAKIDMGNKESKQAEEGEDVFLNVYNLDDAFANTPGFGIFHSGVEVYGAGNIF